MKKLTVGFWLALAAAGLFLANAYSDSIHKRVVAEVPFPTCPPTCPPGSN